MRGNQFIQPGLGELLQKQQEEALNRDILRAQAEQYRIKAQQARDPNRVSGNLPSYMAGFERHQQYTPEQREAFEKYLQMTKVDPYLQREGALRDPVTGEFKASPTLGGALSAVRRDEIRGVAPAEAEAAAMKTEAQKRQELYYDPLITEQKGLATGRAEKFIKDEKKNQVRAQVTNRLTDVANLYRDLKKEGGTIDPSRSVIGNIGARLGASTVGQAIGGALGTKEQEIRQSIEQMRPTLMSDIRQATEMGAKGLDSEKELEFYLQAVSSPSRTMGANMAALKVLDSAYGLGAAKVAASPKEIEKLRKEFEESVKQDSGGNNTKTINGITYVQRNGKWYQQ